MTPGRRSPLAIALGLVVLALLATPTASAAIEGEVRFDLTSLEEADVAASLNLTGEEADEIRNRTDRDDDGEVGALEAAGAEEFLGNRIEGETGAYTMDGHNYTIASASVDAERLQGPVDREGPVELTIRAEASTSPGQAPHTFAIQGQLTSFSGETHIAHTVTAPDGYRIEETENFAQAGDCRAVTEPGTEEASVTFAAADGNCAEEDGIPGPGAAAALVSAGLAALAIRRRGRVP